MIDLTFMWNQEQTLFNLISERQGGKGEWGKRGGEVERERLEGRERCDCGGDGGGVIVCVCVCWGRVRDVGSLKFINLFLY